MKQCDKVGVIKSLDCYKVECYKVSQTVIKSLFWYFGGILRPPTVIKSNGTLL
jgi:hypothetical protein